MYKLKELINIKSSSTTILRLNEIKTNEIKTLIKHFFNIYRIFNLNFVKLIELKVLYIKYKFIFL